MRRAEREITDRAELLAVVEGCTVCRLGLARDNVPYVVPLNFGYEEGGGTLTLYFHCAKQGQKLEIIDRNPVACFEMDRAHRLIAGEDACHYSYAYESIIGHGRIARVTDPAEKIKGLTLLMRHYAPECRFELTEREAAGVTVLRLTAEQFTGKRH